jgi:hypothetical protein
MVVFFFAQTSAAYMLSVVERLQCLSVEYEERVTIHGVPASDQYQAESAVSRESASASVSGGW